MSRGQYSSRDPQQQATRKEKTESITSRSQRETEKRTTNRWGGYRITNLK